MRLPFRSDDRRAGLPAQGLARPRVRMLLLAVLALCSVSFPAWAHSGAASTAGPQGGISLPSLTHGQMRVIDDNLPAILDLADRQYPRDWTLQRLHSYVILQRFVCAWGVVPGSVTDEASPFNECAHAFLAGARTLLVHLQVMPGSEGEKRALVQKIEREMLNQNASLVLCRFSDQPFNTAAYVTPDWTGIPFHPATAGAFGGAAALAAALIFLTVHGIAKYRSAGPERPMPLAHLGKSGADVRC